MRRSQLSDTDLRKQLLRTPEVSLDAVPGSTQRLLAEHRKARGTGFDLGPMLMVRRADLIGLQPRTGANARMSREEALNLQVLRQHLRRELEVSLRGLADDVVDLRPDPKRLRQRLLENEMKAVWLRPEAIPTLRQLLMHEQQGARQILVEILGQIKGRLASRVLAERALFDLHPDVRAAALVALSGRPAAEYEDTLVGGLRYPWPAVADHAAEALVALDLRHTVTRLIPLLDARDLAEPFPVDWAGKRRTMVPELVRVNHLRNCLLCHAPSLSPADVVRGEVPNVAQLLPLPSSGPRLFQASASRTGGGGGGGGWSGGGGGGGGGGNDRGRPLPGRPDLRPGRHHLPQAGLFGPPAGAQPRPAVACRPAL
jgi:hypothetical protein